MTEKTTWAGRDMFLVLEEIASLIPVGGTSGHFFLKMIGSEQEHFISEEVGQSLMAAIHGPQATDDYDAILAAQRETQGR